MGYAAEPRLAKLASFVRGELSDRPQRHTPGGRVPTAAGAIFHDVGFFTRRLPPRAEAFRSRSQTKYSQSAGLSSSTHRFVIAFPRTFDPFKEPPRNHRKGNSRKRPGKRLPGNTIFSRAFRALWNRGEPQGYANNA